jgi:hypothetical protein
MKYREKLASSLLQNIGAKITGLGRRPIGLSRKMTPEDAEDYLSDMGIYISGGPNSNAWVDALKPAYFRGETALNTNKLLQALSVVRPKEINAGKVVNPFIIDTFNQAAFRKSLANAGVERVYGTRGNILADVPKDLRIKLNQAARSHYDEIAPKLTDQGSKTEYLTRTLASRFQRPFMYKTHPLSSELEAAGVNVLRLPTDMGATPKRIRSYFSTKAPEIEDFEFDPRQYKNFDKIASLKGYRLLYRT